MNRMDPIKVKKYKQLLLTAKQSLIQHVLETERANIAHNDQGDMVDIADTQINNTIVGTLSDLDQIKLKEIEHSLEKIKERTYGICEGTGKKIPGARLNHIPWTRYTADHAEKLEQENRMTKS